MSTILVLMLVRYVQKVNCNFRSQPIQFLLTFFWIICRFLLVELANRSTFKHKMLHTKNGSWKSQCCRKQINRRFNNSVKQEMLKGVYVPTKMNLMLSHLLQGRTYSTYSSNEMTSFCNMTFKTS